MFSLAMASPCEYIGIMSIFFMHTVIVTFREDKDVDVKFSIKNPVRFNFRRNYSPGGIL